MIRIVFFSFGLMTAAGFPTIVAAQDNCQRFVQDDGSAKVLCQDKKGRWIEQKNSKKVKYHPLRKARVVYEGTRTVQAFQDTANRSRGEISLGTIFGTVLMNPIGQPSVMRVKITIEYDDTKIVFKEHLLQSGKTYSYSGTRLNKKCDFVKNYHNLPFKFNSKCGQMPFAASASSPSRNGHVLNIKYDTHQVSYTDLYQAELDKRRRANERQLLQDKCNNDSLEACTALEEYGGATSAPQTSASPLVYPKSNTLASTPSENLEANQPAKAIGQARWARRIIDNYPNLALRNEWQGTVGVRLVVGENGRVSECAVSQSSRYESLDTAACKGFTRFARFTPATDADARPKVGEYETTITYRLN